MSETKARPETLAGARIVIASSRFRREPVSPGWAPTPSAAGGSDRDRIGAWPERGIPGTQLGPDRNGRQC